MAIGFGAVLGIVVIERVDLAIGRVLWWQLVLAAVGSLIYWRAGGDLRFYGLLQGWALVLVPLMLILFPGRYADARNWFVVLGLYGLAKVFEVGDRQIYRFGEVVSGHTLKHLCAGIAAFLLARHLAIRARTNSSDGTASRSA
jgi:hypothetical protein